METTTFPATPTLFLRAVRRIFNPWVLLAFLLFPCLSAHAQEDSLRKSLVKIFTTIQNPNYYEPWRVGSQETVSGSGSILSGHRILTNAHVVSNQIFIQVLKEGDSQKYTAKVVAVAHDCDLAVLQVDDPKFFEGTRPVTFGSLPNLRDRISVYGYPVGGEELSITEGVVSRVELVTYAHSMRTFLGAQTDAAINPGNSGGPVFKNGKMVGVAFQGFNAIVAQNTGYFVPIPIVQRFLRVIQKGPYQEIPALGVYAQTLENPTLRSYLRMKPGQSGLLASKVVYGSSSWGLVKENDVLMSTDGYPIANDGTIAFRNGERLGFQYPLCTHSVGDLLRLKVLREGKTLTLKVPLKKECRLVPYVRYDESPSYFIFDGLIFQPLDTNYLNISKDSNPEFVRLYFDGLPSPDLKQVVVINHIIPHEINKGYDSTYTNLIVKKVNGIPITEMKDLIAAFQKPVDGRDLIEIDKAKEVGTLIVLDAAKSKQATAEILDRNNIPSDRSEDLK